MKIDALKTLKKLNELRPSGHPHSLEIFADGSGHVIDVDNTFVGGYFGSYNNSVSDEDRQYILDDLIRRVTEDPSYVPDI